MSLELRHWGLVAYPETYAAMQAFTQARIDAAAAIAASNASQETSVTPENLSEIGRKPASNLRNQLWICEHPAVYTQGLAGKPEHLLLPGDIPVVATNRGGQVTYHGPGQVVAYPLIDLKQAGYFVKEYVYRLEESVLKTLAHFGVTGHRVAGSPGIYVRLDDPFSHAALSGPAHPAEPFRGLGKIAALGIKISRHYTYHGVALNVAMDLAPFSRINPCGYANLVTTDLSTIGVAVGWQEAANVLSHKLGVYLAP